MTALVFVAGLVLAWLHWHFAAVGWLIFGNLTIYVALFVVTLATAVAAAFVSDDRRCIYAALVLVANFTGSHFAWTTDDPLLWGGVNDVVTAAWFILAGQTRWELTIGGLSLACVAAAVLGHFGIIPDHLTRDNSLFIAWSYPDIVAILGHAANVTLGAGAGDAGKVVRRDLVVRPVFVADRSYALSRLRLMAPGRRKKA